MEYDPLRQFALVLASVAAGAILLPELSSDLWTISSEQVRKLIPDSRRRSLARALIDAESSDQEWNELVYSEALLPLIEAGRSPWLNLRNLSYSIRVHLDREAPVTSLGPAAHYVDTVLHAERVLPPASGDGSYWVSIARSHNGLATEFEHERCLGRELVELGDMVGQVWFDAVTELCRVSVVVNGQVQQIEQEYDSGMPDVARFRFRPELESPLERIPVRVSFDFPIQATVSTFPVIFSGYYCGGAAVVTVVLHYGESEPTFECHAFLARRVGMHRERNQVTSREGPGWKEMSFSTGRDSVMWPGSGVLLTWSTGST